MDSRHADIVERIDRRAQLRGCYRRFLRDREVRCAGGYDKDSPRLSVFVVGRRSSVVGSGRYDNSGFLVVDGFGELGLYGLGDFGSGAGGEDFRTALLQPADDGEDVL